MIARTTRGRLFLDILLTVQFGNGGRETRVWSTELWNAIDKESRDGTRKILGDENSIPL